MASCLLLHEPNIRYATGAAAMPVWSMSTFVRSALVPAEGRPILFEHTNSIHRSERVTDADIRPMRMWAFHDDPEPEADAWAAETIEAMGELGVAGEPLAVDRLATPGFVALQRAGLTLLDSAAVTQAAREVKTPEEVALLERNGRVVETMLGSFERAVVPGVRERELLAVHAEVLLAKGGEYLATNTVCSGPNTNPWRAEATDRRVEAGDVVFVDTDCVGIEGYFFCVSRTFLCGDGPPPDPVRDTYRAALEWLQGMKEVVRPGRTCGELATLAPPLPEKYLPQRYEIMIHGIGLEEESPSVCYPIDPQPNPDRVVRENMALVVELYAGEPGADHAVKLGDQVLVTRDGVRELANYPFDERLR